MRAAAPQPLLIPSNSTGLKTGRAEQLHPHSETVDWPNWRDRDCFQSRTLRRNLCPFGCGIRIRVLDFGWIQTLPHQV